MKKAFAVLLMVALFVGTMAIGARAEMYCSGNLSLVFVSDIDLYDGVDTARLTTDPGFGLLGALGGDLGEGLRLEAEVGYRQNDLKDISAFGISVPVNGDVSALSFMGNAFYNFETETAFSPFLGGGVGFANVEGDIEGLGKKDDTVFAYQLSAGGGLELQENLSLDLQYRFFATADPDFAGVKAEYSSHNLMVGLRFSFN